MSRRYRVFHARLRAARLAGRVATKLHPYCEYVPIQHLPAARCEARWGHGRPPNELLREVVASGAPAYRRAVESIVSLASDLARIPRDATSPHEPKWANPWIPPLDAACLYAFVSCGRPRRYVEVGSGNSTLFVHRARRDCGLDTTITSIDPSPRAEVDAVCDRVLRSPLEQVDLGLFGELEPGDVVFVDNSHLALMGSDAVVFLLEVLPSLPAGVLVGFHDVFLPFDYFPEWGDYFFGEQYVLAGLLLGELAGGAVSGPAVCGDAMSHGAMSGGRWLEPYMASYWVSTDEDLAKPLEPLWQEHCFRGLDPTGWSFWFSIGHELGRSARNAR